MSGRLEMENQAMFLDCPAYLGGDKAVRCGLPAEVEALYSVSSTDGRLQSARIRCPRGHWFNGHLELLAVPEQPARPPVSARLRALTSCRGSQTAGQTCGMGEEGCGSCS